MGTDFNQPVLVTSPQDDDRLFVVEQRGTVLVLDERGTGSAEPFLDIRHDVFDASIKQGLLGLAFHPHFASNGRLFVNFTNASGNTQIVEYTSTDGLSVDPVTERVLLAITRPTERHNGGMLEFGPDGSLYVGVGDGGAASVNGQNPNTLLGTILRIEVDGEAPYTISDDNPFVTGGGAPEVWAYGLRNPWRFSIDAPTGRMYIGDVGQAEIEEIDVLDLDGGGANLGWLPLEGSQCFLEGCDSAGTVLPVVEYDHGQGCSVTGGYVYRGPAIPELHGHYFYADWCRGWIRTFNFAAGEVLDRRDWSGELGEIGMITSFGVDARGEIYITTWDGTVARIVAVRSALP